MEYLIFLQYYGGVLIGLAILAVAVFLLPSGIRWYVASAGIAVLGFRVWQIYTTNKKFKDWDKKQKELTDQFSDLKTERDKLSTKANQLDGELEVLKKERDTLQQRSDDLSQQGGTLDAERQTLSENLAKAKKQAAETDARIAQLKDAQALIDKAENLLKGQAKVKPNLSDEDLMKLAQGM